MNISIKWLSEYLGKPININKADIKDYCDKMTFSGSKVEGFEMLADELENIVIGKLLSVGKHPDADKLVVCSVDIGESEPIQIVTGATNVKAGDIIPVALHNSVIAGGKKINKSKIRGVESFGMLCSLEELGLTINDFPYAVEDGILVLEGEDLADITLGQDVKSALLLDDAAVEFEITPNRADCFSLIGMARESAATFDCELKLSTPIIKREDKSDNITSYLSVKIENYELCPRYTAKIVKDVKIAPSPMWLRARLRACGVRPINNIVDITNYVMLEYGQPMHAFDYNYLGGSEIIVRNALADEKITTLDGQERKLDTNMLVIADSTKPVALAGVMGGENSEITDTTRIIVFESANFDKMSVRKTSRKLGLRTDSSAKFEKGLDPYLTKQAIERACELVELLNCGTVVSGVIDEYKELPESVFVPFEPDKINALLGANISREKMIEILEKLGFKLVGENSVEVPSYRAYDILSHYSDLAEEVSRIYGYGILAPSFEVSRGGRNNYQKFLLKLHDTLLSGGFYETYTYSFITPHHFDRLNLPSDSTLRDCIKLINPIGEELSVMRTNLLSSMLATLAKNCASRNEYGYFYDIAKTYFANANTTSKSDAPIKGELPAIEKNALSVGFFDTSDKTADFYTLKGIVENVLTIAGVKYRLSSDISSHELSSAFHPGRSAVIVSDSSDNDGKIYGIFGEVHPSVLENFEIDAKSYIAEIDIDALFEAYECRGDAKVYKPLPRYPAVTRDLALVCDDALESAAIGEIITKYGGKFLESVRVFDVFKSDKIGADKKSIAFALTFRNTEGTLSDEDINPIITKILASLEKIGVELRK